MKVMPIRYVKDMAASERFYAALGLTVHARQRGGGWVEMAAGGGMLALHEDGYGGPSGPPVELSLAAEEPLEAVRDRLAAAGFGSDLVDEAFGRSLRVTDPDGLRFQVNEHDPELYT